MSKKYITLAFMWAVVAVSPALIDKELTEIQLFLKYWLVYFFVIANAVILYFAASKK